MTGLEIGLAIAAAAGTGMQVVGSIKEGYDKADAANRSAAMKYAQADELMSREAINEQLMSEHAREAELHQSGFGGMMKIRSDLQFNLTQSKRDAEFKARMLRAGAEMDTNLASDSIAAGWIGGASTFLKSGYSMYKDFKPAKSSDGLYSSTVAHAPTGFTLAVE